MDQRFREALERNWQGIEESVVFAQLYHPDMETFLDDPWPAIQLAIAILQDKPIIVAVPPGRTPPERLIRLADHVVFGTPDELASQIARIVGGA